MVRRDEVYIQSGYLQNLVVVQMGPWQRAAALVEAATEEVTKAKLLPLEAAAVESCCC